jgi:hypothetical protein
MERQIAAVVVRNGPDGVQPILTRSRLSFSMDSATDTT